MRFRNRPGIHVINVKPYWIIINNEGKFLCDGDYGLPLVFDTNELAIFCIHDNKLDENWIKKMELEDLCHMCRDRKVPFDKFILITKPGHLIWRKPVPAAVA